MADVADGAHERLIVFNRYSDLPIAVSTFALEVIQVGVGDEAVMLVYELIDGGVHSVEAFDVNGKLRFVDDLAIVWLSDSRGGGILIALVFIAFE